MTIRATTIMITVLAFAGAGETKAAAKRGTFFRDGGWTGEVQATSSGGLDTASAWAIGRHTRATATKACSGRDGAERVECIRRLVAEPETRIFADCTTATTWREGDANRISLSADSKSGRLDPLEDDKAWSMPLSHRAKWAISSWLAFLCPGSAKSWGIGMSDR